MEENLIETETKLTQSTIFKLKEISKMVGDVNVVDTITWMINTFYIALTAAKGNAAISELKVNNKKKKLICYIKNRWF